MAKLTQDDIQTLKKALSDTFATKNDVIEFKDAILKEIKDLRDDVAIITGYRDMIEDHDQRLEIIEKTLKIPQTQ